MNGKILDRWLEIRGPFGNRLRQERCNAGETQADFAAFFSLSSRVLVDMENGNWPSPTTVVAMADVVFGRQPKKRRKGRIAPAKRLQLERTHRLGLESVARWVETADCDLRQYHPQWFFDFALSSNLETKWGPPGLFVPESSVAVEAGCAGVRLAFRTLVQGPFEARDVQITARLDEEFAPPKALAGPVVDQLVLMWDAARRAGVVVQDIPLARLVRFAKDRHRLLFTVQPTVYSLFAAMNLAARKSTSITTVAADTGLAPDTLTAIDSEHLPNPLNVVAILVSSDEHLFISQRSETPYERPHCFQASVGGFVHLADESPATALKREFMEELGLQIFESQIRFTAFGKNLRTCEPDLLALVRSAASAEEILSLYRQRLDKTELRQVLALSLAKADQVIRCLFALPFSQDSDRAAVLLALQETLGVAAVESLIKRFRAGPYKVSPLTGS